MIWDRLTLIRTRFADRRAASGAAQRWSRADDRDPDLARDLIRLGGVLAKSPARFVDGTEAPDPIDPVRLAKAEGRRELALELLAMMKISPMELNSLMESDHV